MDKFLETYSLPKVNQEETDHLNRLITRNEIEYVIKHSLQTKVQGQRPHREFYQTNKEFISILLKLFQETEEVTLLKIFYEATIIIIPKPDKDTTKKYRPISLNRESIILNKTLAS